MANTTGFMGLKQIGFLPGFAPDYQLMSHTVGAANTTAIYRGDLVVFSSGLIQRAENGTGRVDGVFDGCTFTDSSGNTKWQPSCPASQTATVYILKSPGSLFIAQSNNTAIGTASINRNIGFIAGTGTTIGGGFSGYLLDAGNIGTTSTYPLRIVALGSQFLPASANGADASSSYNQVVVTFNSQDFRSGQTGD